jgi:hypothetical protein
MRANTLQEALVHAPFRPFNIHADGRVVRVQHPEQVWVAPDKATVIVGAADGSLAILDLDHISSLSLAPRNRRASA